MAWSELPDALTYLSDFYSSLAEYPRDTSLLFCPQLSLVIHTDVSAPAGRGLQ
jgi:hypothetical protein